MRPLAGVLSLLLVASLPVAVAQGQTVATSVSISGAGPILDLTEEGTRSVTLQVQFSASQPFTCTGDATVTVDLALTTNGPVTAALDNDTVTFTIPQAQSPVQPYKGDASATLTITKTAPHQEAETLVTATYAGGAVSGCLPSNFQPSNASIAVRSTALEGGSGGASPNVTITQPLAGAEGSAFAMVVSVSGFDLKPVGTTPGVVAGQGHIHYLVDGKPAEGDYATPATNFTFKGLSPGNHTLRAELVNNDHTPLDPPVYAEVTVTATGGTGASPTPTPTASTPTNGAPDAPATGGEEKKSFLPGPGALALGLAGVAAALVLRRRA